MEGNWGYLMRKCQICGKEIELFAEYWLREPDGFDSNGVLVNKGKALPFCGLRCVFAWAGNELRKQKEQRDREGGVPKVEGQ